MEIVLSSYCHVLNQPLQLFCFLINSERVTSSVLLKLVGNNESLLVLNSMIMIIIHVSLFLGNQISVYVLNHDDVIFEAINLL